MRPSSHPSSPVNQISVHRVRIGDGPTHFPPTHISLIQQREQKGEVFVNNIARVTVESNEFNTVSCWTHASRTLFIAGFLFLTRNPSCAQQNQIPHHALECDKLMKRGHDTWQGCSAHAPVLWVIPRLDCHDPLNCPPNPVHGTWYSFVAEAVCAMLPQATRHVGLRVVSEWLFQLYSAVLRLLLCQWLCTACCISTWTLSLLPSNEHNVENVPCSICWQNGADSFVPSPIAWTTSLLSMYCHVTVCTVT